MIESILAGASDPKALADLAKGRLRQKRAELERALTGQVTAHRRLLLTMHLAHIDFLNEQITAMSAEIAERLRPFEAELARLDTIPGVGRGAAEVILAELGTTMGQFPSAAHAASWAGMCPGNHESAGKRKGVRSRRGSVWLRRALTESAMAAVRSKQCYLATRYRRLVVRQGHQKAVFAVAHTILVTAYCLLARQQDYQDFDPTERDARHRERARQRAIAQLHSLDYEVEITLKQAG